MGARMRGCPSFTFHAAAVKLTAGGTPFIRAQTAGDVQNRRWHINGIELGLTGMLLLGAMQAKFALSQSHACMLKLPRSALDWHFWREVDSASLPPQVRAIFDQASNCWQQYSCLNERIRHLTLDMQGESKRHMVAP